MVPPIIDPGPPPSLVMPQPPLGCTPKPATDGGKNSVKVKVPGATVTAVHPSSLPWKVLGFARVAKVNVKSEG